MDVPDCSLEGCDKPVHCKDYCYGHYMKNWRYGSPTPSRTPNWLDITGQRFGTLVVMERQGRQWVCICDCGKDRRVSVGDLNRYGDASTCGDRKAHRRQDAGYGAAHWRCVKDRGQARAYKCVDCGQPAQQWSYDHCDPNERMSTVGGYQLPYSTSPEHYRPRCVPCHKTFDLGRNP